MSHSQSTLLEGSTGTCSRDISGEEIPALPWARDGGLHCKHSTFQSEQEEDHYKFQDSLVYILCTINHVSMSKVYGYVGTLLKPQLQASIHISTHMDTTIAQKLCMFVCNIHAYVCIGICNSQICLSHTCSTSTPYSFETRLTEPESRRPTSPNNPLSCPHSTNT